MLLIKYHFIYMLHKKTHLCCQKSLHLMTKAQESGIVLRPKHHHHKPRGLQQYLIPPDFVGFPPHYENTKWKCSFFIYSCIHNFPKFMSPEVKFYLNDVRFELSDQTATSRHWVNVNFSWKVKTMLYI